MKMYLKTWSAMHHKPVSILKPKNIILALLIMLAVLGVVYAIKTLPNAILRFQQEDNPSILLNIEVSSVKSQKRELKRERDLIVWKIYGLESSYGKNDGCQRQGKFNGFGFGQNKYEWRCYNTFEEVVTDVHLWVESMQNQGYDISTMLCYYQSGKLTNNCPYYQKYLQLN